VAVSHSTVADNRAAGGGPFSVVNAGTTVQLQGATGFGGGIDDQLDFGSAPATISASLNITDCTIHGNVAMGIGPSGPGSGGGLDSVGVNATLTTSLVSGNQAMGGPGGGSFAERDVSFRTLANELNARGIPAPGASGKRCTTWMRQVVVDILENPHCVGDSVWGKSGQGKYSRVVNGQATAVSGIPRSKKGRPKKHRNTEGLTDCPDAHEGIIDRELWCRVQAKVAARRSERRFPRGIGYPLAGLVVCGHCSKRMHGATNKYKLRTGRQAYRRYVCSSYNLSGISACGYHAIREEKLLPFLIKQLQDQYLTPERLEQLQAKILRKVTARQQADPAKAERLRDKLARLDDDIREGARNLLRAGPHIDIASEALSELRDERAKVARELDALERVIAKPPEDLERTVNEAMAKLGQLRDRLAEVQPDRLREVLRQIVSSVVLYFDSEQRKVKVYHRLIKGVVKLRPLLNVARIKECQACEMNTSSMRWMPRFQR
jgi:hypothetical protein